jgi:N-acyl-D-amino-acid deacylase
MLELSDICDIHISHLKCVGCRGIERAKLILNFINRYRNRRNRVSVEVYPYEASHSTIGLLFPDFARPPNNYTNVVRSRRNELSFEIIKRVNFTGILYFL